MSSFKRYTATEYTALPATKLPEFALVGVIDKGELEHVAKHVRFTEDLPKVELPARFLVSENTAGVKIVFFDEKA